MRNSIMMQSPILRTKKKISEPISLPVLESSNLPEGSKCPSLPEKKECQKEKPRAYKSLHSSEYVELTQSNSK